jgi:general stress protein 26
MSDDAERVWDLMEKISICMLASWDGRELTSRPMGAFVRRRNNAVYFLTDV